MTHRPPPGAQMPKPTIIGIKDKTFGKKERD